MCLCLQRAVHLWYEIQGRDIYVQEMRIVSAMDDALSPLWLSPYLNSLHVWSTFMALMETEGFPPILTPFTWLDFLYLHLVFKQLFVSSVMSKKTWSFKRRRPLNRWNNICICRIVLTLMMKVVGLAAFVTWKAVLFYSFDMTEAEVCSVHQLGTSWAIDNLQIHHVFVMASLWGGSLPTSIM